MEEEETFPDIGAMSDEELRSVIDQYTKEEQEVSYKRRILHGRIDILRAELVNRLRVSRESGSSLISGADVEMLSDILAGRHTGEEKDSGA
jgi:Mg2+/Co2+ transporter CorB